ncbi:hypothetical protein BJ875DRAFT_365382 [Amylocarpus encephaloides]|uniref:C2H2-type domain-containing protein n=1 Tax=Amylocarpus encephaloides TaxID=45428 RepID=A0A9P7YUT5_9HELO|nr:hypothetical protein BJ875DRAFT_365382 [Amylocarpus encephaloides]
METGNFFEASSVDPSKIALNGSSCGTIDDVFLDESPGLSYYIQPENHNNLPTPLSLGWDETVEINMFYDLNVQNLKEPHLELRHEYQASASNNPLPPIVYLDKATESVKNAHACLYPGQTCWKEHTRRSFRRPADLDRHYKVVHKALGHETFRCDHPRCNRHDEPFTRRDHARDHYRDYHKEDLGAYKCEKATDRPQWQAKQQQWKEERVIDPRWWRCSKCLNRVWHEESQWSCPGCNKNCEENRVQARLEPENTQTPCPACPDCDGVGSVFNSLGIAIECPLCNSFSNSSNYNDLAWPEHQS